MNTITATPAKTPSFDFVALTDKQRKNRQRRARYEVKKQVLKLNSRQRFNYEFL
jgi:hypothetical protein